MRKLGTITALGVSLVVVGVAVTGCSAAPSHDEVAKRFKIEFASSTGWGNTDTFDDVASQAADDAFKGMCGNVGYRSGLIDGGVGEDYLYAWDATCLMYFEHDMSQAQVSRAKETIVQHALNEQ